MNIKATTQLRPVGEPRVKADDRRILLFGDSHSHAVQRAIEKRRGKGQRTSVLVHRLAKEKNGNHIGDTSLEQFLAMVSDLDAEEVVVSMIGGNQHSVFSLIQHPVPFDFFTPDGRVADQSLQVVPYRAFEAVFTKGLTKGDGKSLQALRNATSARVVHVIPPPPKADNAFIEQFHESHFAQDLPKLGVSKPELRLKFWKLQTRILEQICSDLDIEVMMPPANTVDEHGYLRPEYYAQDATHGNWRYGERVLQELETLCTQPGAHK